MKRMHDMPFGVQVREDGSTRFRLWAPSAQHADLCLAGDAPQILPMQRPVAGATLPAWTAAWYREPA